MVWKFCGKAQNCAFPQNFHTMKSDEFTIFYATEAFENQGFSDVFEGKSKEKNRNEMESLKRNKIKTDFFHLTLQYLKHFNNILNCQFLHFPLFSLAQNRECCWSAWSD